MASPEGTAESMLPPWPYIAATLLVTFILANVAAAVLEMVKARRIKRKTEQLMAGKGATTPVTVVTGFLGAGKTTLLNRILSSSTHGKRIAVIENEVGAISIDHELLQSSVSDQLDKGIFVMKNGCICCTAKGVGSELETVLDRLTVLLETTDFDYVVVETSGLADPGPILQTFFQSTASGGRFVLDGVLTVVDAKNIGMHLSGDKLFACRNEAERQIAYADRVIVNKVDLVDETALERVHSLIAGVNPSAPVINTSYSKVDVASLLDIHAFSAAVFEKTLTQKVHHNHTHGVSTVSLEDKRSVDVALFKLWMGDILKDQWKSLFRVKGILRVEGAHCAFVAQGTHADFLGALTEGLPVPRTSQMVFIGRDLDEHQLREGFNACLLIQDADESGAALTPGERARVRRRLVQ